MRKIFNEVGMNLLEEILEEIEKVDDPFSPLLVKRCSKLKPRSKTLAFQELPTALSYFGRDFRRIRLPTEPPWLATWRLGMRKAFLDACDFLEGKGFEDEVRLHAEQVLAAMDRGENLQLGCAGQGWKWMLSLVWWALCEKKGEEEALSFISALLWIDRAFFLAQPWVQRTINYWHERGNKEKVCAAFFGTKRTTGKRGQGLSLENFRRDIEVVIAVQGFLQEGFTYRKAVKQVVECSKKYTLEGVSEVLSSANVRRIYESFHPAHPTFRSLFSFG